MLFMLTNSRNLANVAGPLELLELTLQARTAVRVGPTDKDGTGESRHDGALRSSSCEVLSNCMRGIELLSPVGQAGSCRI